MYQSVIDALNWATDLLAGKTVRASESESSSVVPSAGRLVDLTAFFATLELLGRSTQEDAPELTKKGMTLAHKLQDGYVADVTQFVVPVLDGWGLRAFKTRWVKLARHSKDGEVYAERAVFVLAVLNKLRGKQNIMHSIFTDGRVFASAKMLSELPELPTAEEQLKLLSVIRPVGHMANVRSWMKKAFDVMSVDTPEFEDVIADVSLAEDLGQRLRNVDVAITNTDTEEGRARLEAERASIVNTIQETASQSVNPQAVLSTAATAASAKFNHKTETGRALMLSPEQEDAMMVRGNSIISSGAGSGKTRVMAGKVVYHIKELGAKPSQFIATSFSNKSAHELVDRIKKYGGTELLEDGPSTEGMGTTHRVAGGIIRKYGNRVSQGEKPLSSSGQTTLLRMAMEQVKLHPAQPVRAPLPRSFFDDPRSIQEGDVLELPKEELSPLREAAEQAAAIFEKSTPRLGWKTDMVVDIINKIAKGELKQLSQKQTPYANDGFAAAGLDFRISASVVSAAGKKYSGPLTGDSQYWRTPANKWFNLGVGEKGFVDADGKAIGTKQLGLKITKWKANLITPEQAFEEYGPKDIFAATYGAYEWLKNNAVDYNGWRDHDDTILRACQIMVTNPTALAKLRAGFKYILVDEAQDLNKCVLGSTKVITPSGEVTVADVQVGDKVLSFENGQVVFNEVKAKAKSEWKRGYKIKTASGRELTMSPDHRIYATPMTKCPEGQMALYLMYREDMGFRIGTTTRLFHHNGETIGRASQERADAAWILEIGDTDDILYKEQAYSLKYAIPTYIFEGKARGCDQSRIDKLFSEFGNNGRALLDKYDLSFGHPHWAALSNTRGRFNRKVVNLAAHRGKGKVYVQRGSTVQASWTEEQNTAGLGLNVYTVKGGRFAVNKLCSNYEEAYETAHSAARIMGARVVETLYFDDETLPLTTAAALFPGMKVVVHLSGVDASTRDLLPIADYKREADRIGISIDGVGGEKNTGKRAIHEFLLSHGAQLPSLGRAESFLDEIVEVAEVSDGDFFDITVARSSNFFGNGILSHNCQHLMFGLISGTYDPDTQKPYEDGRISADTYTLIGDDKQCVAIDTMIATPSGIRRADELKPGDTVTAFRNGKNVGQRLRHVVESSWTWGYKVTTESGASLTMSPNHRLWASEPRTSEDQMVVYLMYRSDMGFRVGITNKGKVGQEDYHSSYGGRAFLEKAERLWVLNIVDSRDEALLQEQRVSLKYGIPTMVFNGEHREMNQNRIEAIFQEFGRNGFRLLEDRHLSFKHPHWLSQSYSKHGRSRLVVNLVAHSGSNTQVSTEWSGDQFDDKTAGLGVVHTKDDRRRLRRWFANYREALAFAEEAADRLGGSVSHKLSTPDGSLREVTASGLFIGMQVPVIEGEAFALESIVSIEKVDNKFIDLDVDDASNFYGNGILSHNSIYEFRGATPDKFIKMSDIVGDGQKFKTVFLDTNYRSGKLIVDAANHLMSHNSKQIPMTCKAHEDRKGQGAVTAKIVPTHEDGAAFVAATVRDLCDGEGAPMTYKDFGVAARTNAELFAFGAEFLKLGIPFRSKINFFNNITTIALLNWMRLANASDGDKEVINEAVLSSYGAPNFNLNKIFDEQLQRKANGQNYLAYLKNGGWRSIYEGSQSWRNERYVRPYTEMLSAVKAKKGTPTEVLNFIMELRGPAIAAGKPSRSMLEDLVEEVKKDPEATDLLVEDANTKVTDEDVRQLALAPIQPLLSLCSNYQDLGPCLSYIDRLIRANDKQYKKDDPEAADYEEPAVVLDTVHGWKGLEVKHIFIPMAKNVFPHVRSTKDEDSLASERRLGYVAITRGQDKVTIICPEVSHTGKEAGPSPFVAEACIPIQGAEDKKEKVEASFTNEEIW
jgi:superfamily I DNA/RNA helicase